MKVLYVRCSSLEQKTDRVTGAKTVGFG